MTTTTAATAFDRITHALRAKQKTVRQDRPGHVMAQCPAHDDHTPSLSITRIEGQVLMHDHGHCHIDDVLTALGMHKRDLFDNHEGIQYRYNDGRIVHRSPDKRFRQSGYTNGNSTTLYRLEEVKHAGEAGKTIFLVEGEKDVHALESLGEVATTAPMGAANLHKCDLSPLHGAEVIALPDRDGGGVEVGAASESVTRRQSEIAGLHARQDRLQRHKRPHRRRIHARRAGDSNTNA